MRDFLNAKIPVRAALPALAALALGACGSQDSDTVYETDVVDQSGGELIVTQDDPDAVPVNVPETPMVSVPGAPVSTETDDSAE